MSFNYDMSNISDFNLSFMIDIGTSEWYSGQSKQGDDFLNEDLKKKIPKNQIFRINSLIFNLEKHRREILTKYDCYYSEENNSLSIILSEEFDYANFTKEIMINILEFTQKVGIEIIYMLVSKRNKKFMKIVQDMTIVGFGSDEKVENTKIGDDNYLILSMSTKEANGEIEDVLF